MKVFLGPYNNDGSKRKEVVELDDYDTWNADYTLAVIAYPLLKKLRETKHSYPLSDMEEAPQELPKEARWDWILDQMIWSFEQMQSEDHEDKFFDPETYKLINPEEYKAHEDKITYGCMLFGKYFRHLWD
jgi:hypothetical protein